MLTRTIDPRTTGAALGATLGDEEMRRHLPPLQRGDEIVAVNGVPTAGMKVEAVRVMLKRIDTGSPVTLTFANKIPVLSDGVWGGGTHLFVSPHKGSVDWSI